MNFFMPKRYRGVIAERIALYEPVLLWNWIRVCICIYFYDSKSLSKQKAKALIRLHICAV